MKPREVNISSEADLIALLKHLPAGCVVNIFIDKLRYVNIVRDNNNTPIAGSDNTVGKK